MLRSPGIVAQAVKTYVLDNLFVLPVGNKCSGLPLPGARECICPDVAEIIRRRNLWGKAFGFFLHIRQYEPEGIDRRCHLLDQIGELLCFGIEFEVDGKRTCAVYLLDCLTGFF
ncbi:hypothetical protein D3C86_1849910 [compost metagenome]